MCVPISARSKKFIRSSSSSRRHGMYLPSMRASLAVINMDDLNQPNSGSSKPPLPPPANSADSAQPRPPPRTRPKSWTSSIFNAMKSNHKSVNFQSVLEEQNSDLVEKGGNKYRQNCSSEKFNSLPRTNGIDGSEDQGENEDFSEGGGEKLKLPNTRSRTPSPFRSILKGLVKGTEFLRFLSIRSAPTNEHYERRCDKSNH